MQNYQKKIVFYLSLMVAFVSLIAVFSYKEISINNIDYVAMGNKMDLNSDYIYLSDISFLPDKSDTYVGYGTIKLDRKVENNNKISLFHEGENVIFNKGIIAHATSQVTYDISNYSNEFTRFVAKLGIDTYVKTGNGSVSFKIMASHDKVEWDELYITDILRSGDPAVSIDLDIKGYKYLRLYADQGTDGKGSDHATYADARLVKTNYNLDEDGDPLIKKLSYYDEILNKETLEYNYENNMLIILQREFINRLGYHTLQNGITNSSEIRETVKWMMESEQNLKLFIETGNITNREYVLNGLNSLYHAYKDIVGNEGKELMHKKMLIALAITYGSDSVVSPLTFKAGFANYEIVEKYKQIVLNIYDKGYFYNTKEFDTYHMELIRMVMNNNISNEETVWANQYPIYKFPDNFAARFGPWNYMAYVKPNYSITAHPEYYDLANEKKYSDKYQLSNNGVKYTTDTTKVWMSLEAGGICWNMSRVGQIFAKGQGVPTVSVYQPGHEAFFFYTQDENTGIGKWGIGNNVGGWTRVYSSWGWDAPGRYIFNWQSNGFSKPSQNSGGYILLGQAALNNYDIFEKSFYYNLIANSYYTNSMKEQIYNEALNVSNINLDSYINLIKLYISENKKSQDFEKLADRIIDSYTYYPIAMYDLLNAIKPYLDEKVIPIYILKEQNALKSAINASSEDVLQYQETSGVAKGLLALQEELATFSFTGQNKNKIILNDQFVAGQFTLEYSLDGGRNWLSTKKNIVELSKSQINSITKDNDIKLRFVGSSDEYTIDILEGKKLDINNFAIHDGENKIYSNNVNNLKTIEYSYDKDSWYMLDNLTTFGGNRTVYIRDKAKELTLPSNILEFTFNDKDETDETNKYISIENINYVSGGGESQPGQLVEYMVDANPFTKWHTKYHIFATDLTFVVSFDKIRFLSQITYEPAGVNGRIGKIRVYTSDDNKEWELAAENDGYWEHNELLKTIKFSESKAAKYVKIEIIHTFHNGNEETNKYISGTNFNYYEDTTKIFDEYTTIEYSTIKPTKEDVEAKLILGKGNIAISETSYIFKENGSYIFKYIDENQAEQTLEAKVDWIDKEAPTAKITYDTTEITKFAVTATISDITKNAVITNFEGTTYVFNKNGSFVFELKDSLGNIGYVEAKVTWIDEGPPSGNVFYETVENGVKVTIESTSPLKNIEGWILSNDKLSLTKIFNKVSDTEITLTSAINNESTTITIDSNMISDMMPLLVTENYIETTEGVKVIISSNKELMNVDDWEISSDKLTITKIFIKESTDDIVLKTINGNTKIFKLNNKKIKELMPLLISIEYKKTDEGIKVTLISNISMLPVTGWELSSDKLRMTKLYKDTDEMNFEIVSESGKKITIQLDEKLIKDNLLIQDDLDVEEDNISDDNIINNESNINKPSSGNTQNHPNNNNSEETEENSDRPNNNINSNEEINNKKNESYYWLYTIIIGCVSIIIGTFIFILNKNNKIK